MTQGHPRYEARGSIGRGSMGHVELVFDRERGCELALKRLTAPGDDARFLFKQEFWTMAALAHPNLVAALDYGEEPTSTVPDEARSPQSGEHPASMAPYFTMAYVPGADVAPKQDEATVRGWLPDVVAALSFLHARGYVHGDLKPENIRLGADGRARLMDLGLLGRVGQMGGAIRGTPNYIAPEAIRQGAVDGRADLYALGAVLFHVLAGRPPFVHEDSLALLRAHLDTPAPRLESLAPGVSPELAALVARLLAKNPADRPGRATDLLVALGLPVERGPASLLASPLVGRDEATAAIATLLTTPEAVVLAGPEGMGKSRLVAHARAQAQLAGLQVYTAAGTGEDAAPYGSVASWLRALAATDRTGALAPVLARVVSLEGIAPAAALEGPAERTRLHAAVAELAAAATPEALWCVDDWDRLDAASKALVAYVQASPAGRGWRWLFTTAGAAPDVRTLALQPLSAAQSRELAGAILGTEVPASLAAALEELAGGVPGTIQALLAHWASTGALAPVAEGWAIAPHATLDLPAALAQGGRPFDGLDEPGRQVAKAAAVIGTRGELAALAAVAELPDAALFEALAALEGAGLLVREGETYALTRPGRAAVWLAAMPPEELAALHGRAGSWLLARFTPEAGLGAMMAIARHLLQGPQPREGVEWTLRAVAAALAVQAGPAMLATVERALAIPGLADPDRTMLHAQRATILRFEARVDEALQAFEVEVLPHLASLPAAVQAAQRVTFGTLLQQKGRYAEAREAFAASRAQAEEAGDGATAVRAGFFEGRVAYFAGDATGALELLAGAIERSRRTPGRPLLAAVLGLYGLLLGSKDASRLDEALALLDEALASSAHEPVERYETLNNRANLLLSAGRVREARADFVAYRTLAERIGTSNELAFCYLNLGVVDLEMGDLAGAVSSLERGHELAVQQGRKYPQGFGLAYLGLAWVRAGRPQEGLLALERAVAVAAEINNRYLELYAHALSAEARLRLRDLPGARQALAAARRLADAGSHELDDQLAWLALAMGPADLAALASEVAHTSKPNLRARLRLLEATWQAAAGDTARAEEAAQAGLADADAEGLRLVRAELQWRLGNLTGDAVWLREAASEANMAGDPVLEALALDALAALDPGERPAARLARQRVGRIVAELTPALRAAWSADPELAVLVEGDVTGLKAEHLNDLAELTAGLVAATSLEDLLSEALRVFVEWTGMERGFLLLYEGFDLTHKVYHAMGADESDEHSTTLAHQVLWSGKPVYVEDASAHELGQAASVAALALRGLVGVPLHDGQQPVGVMLADRKTLGDRLSPALLDAVMALGRQTAALATLARRQSSQDVRARELDVLYRLALASAGQSDRTAKLEVLVAGAIKLVGAEQGHVLVGDDSAVIASVGPSREPNFSHSVVRWVKEQQAPVAVLDAANDQELGGAASVMALGLRSVLAVPVSHGDERLGVLYLDSQRVLEVPPTVLATLGRIGELAGAAIAST